MNSVWQMVCVVGGRKSSDYERTCPNSPQNGPGTMLRALCGFYHLMPTTVLQSNNSILQRRKLKPKEKQQLLKDTQWARYRGKIQIHICHNPNSVSFSLWSPGQGVSLQIFKWIFTRGENEPWKPGPQVQSLFWVKNLWESSSSEIYIRGTHTGICYGPVPYTWPHLTLPRETEAVPAGGGGNKSRGLQWSPFLFLPVITQLSSFVS